MTRTAALALWSTVVAVGCAAAVLVSCAGSRHASPVRAIDPGTPTRLASSRPMSVSGTAMLPRANPQPARRVGRPVAVRIASVGITAPVTAVGVDNRGDVAIPERVDTVGWYRYSTPPGSAAGSTVLVGHVDSARQGEGAFFRLRDVARGDQVVLELAGGRRLTYRVVSRAQFSKATVPLADLFSLQGRPRLTLVTCGGAFDATIRSYRDNIVITAVPR